MGRAAVADGTVTLCVRLNRWLLLVALPAARRLRASSASGPEKDALNRRAAGSEWRNACEGIATVVDLSSALAPMRISDGATGARLVAGSRVDLDAKTFQEGHAAATIIAQVQVILARLPGAMLVLTPSTTARHFQEWLGDHAQ